MFSAIENSSTSPRRWRSSGMWPTPASSMLARARVPVTSRPASRDRPAVALPQAGDRVDQLGLAVAVDAGDADDLARADVEATRRDLLDPAVVDDVQPLDLEQHGSPGSRRRLLDAQQDRPGRPSRGRATPRSRPRAAPSRSILPRRSTVIRSAISSTSFSLCVMKTIDLPSACRLRDDREQLGRLLRRQHRRRLVEDQDLGAAVERLQDLDPLLLARR